MTKVFSKKKRKEDRKEERCIERLIKKEMWLAYGLVNKQKKHTSLLSCQNFKMAGIIISGLESCSTYITFFFSSLLFHHINFISSSCPLFSSFSIFFHSFTFISLCNSFVSIISFWHPTLTFFSFPLISNPLPNTHLSLFTSHFLVDLIEEQNSNMRVFWKFHL